MMLRVLNLATGDERYYDSSLGPVGALVAAYAQVDKHDWDTRDYERKYAPLVRPCGDLFYLAQWTCGARQL